MADSLSWVQWVSIVEIPVLAAIVAGVIRLIFRHKGEVDREVSELHQRCDKILRCHNQLALDVAKNYVSTEYMKGFEKRMDVHFERLENKIDRGNVCAPARPK